MDIKLPIKVFAVDPATTHSGWAMLELVSIDPLRVRVVKTGEIDGQKLLRQRKAYALAFGKQICVVDALYEEYYRLLSEFNPDYIGCEGGYGHQHMAVLVSITLANNSLRRAAIVACNKPVADIPPTITKKAFTGNGAADKALMRKTYEETPILIKDPTQEEISEHEIDSIGHGIGLIRRDIVGDIVQISAQEKRRARREKAKKKLEKDNA